MAVGLLGLLGGAAACNAGGDDDATLRPVTSAATPPSNGTVATPGSVGSSTPAPNAAGPTDPDTDDLGTSNTVPTTAAPIGTAVDDVSLGANGSASGVAAATSGASSDGAADAGAADAGAAVTDGGLDIADGAVPDDDQIDDLAEPLPPGVDAGAPLAAALDDGQIIGVVDALNAGEVEQAQAVLPRLQSDAVRAFAQIMIEEHRTAGDSFGALALAQQIQSLGSDVADGLRQRNAEAVSTLAATDAAQLDRAYLDAQIQTHTEAEALLADLAAGADSAALGTQLSQLRINVQGHLQSARALQGSVRSATP